MDSVTAWLEFPSGEKIYLTDMCTLGRAPGNRVVVTSERVSRRHAVIRKEADSFQIVDLGSSNGTYLNGQRLARATALPDGGVIEIGMQKMIFRSSQSTGTAVPENESQETVCWLLVIAAAERGCRTPSQDLVDKTLESWSERCQRVIRKYRGATMRAQNEGILAYWRKESTEGGAAAIKAVLSSLRAVQQQTEEFRFALHLGSVVLRSGAAGTLAPTGNEVIYAMQLQRIVPSVEGTVLISETAQAELSAVLPMRQLNAKELRDYRGSLRVYTLEDGTARTTAA